MNQTYPLTPAQHRVLLAIDAFTREHAYAPTLRELCALLDCTSTNNIEGHLLGLERARFIVRDRKIARSIRIVGIVADARVKNGAEKTKWRVGAP